MAVLQFRKLSPSDEGRQRQAALLAFSAFSELKHVFFFFLYVDCFDLKQGYRNPTGFRRWVKVAKSGGLCYAYVMGTWKSKNRHKYLLQYHIIFVCKYRKKLLMSKQISDDIKQFSYEICQKHKAVIRYMETDQDHIHYMIETEPAMSISKIVNLMKSYTTYHIWEKYPNYLRKHFRKEHTFWTDGYFACSVGSVSEEMLRKYIENQGQEGDDSQC